MKLLTLSIATLVLISSNAFAASKIVRTTSSKGTSCTIKSKTVGTFHKTAATYQLAFQKATGACFQQNSQNWVKSHGQQPDQDSQISFVNSCVKDIKCQ